MLHRKSRIPHIDFAFEDLNNKFSEGMLDGVVGQYYGKGIHLAKSKEGDKGMLRVGFVHFLIIFSIFYEVSKKFEQVVWIYALSKLTLFKMYIK